jgi:hypothetical protein
MGIASTSASDNRRDEINADGLRPSEGIRHGGTHLDSRLSDDDCDEVKSHFAVMSKSNEIQNSIWDYHEICFHNCIFGMINNH